MHIRLDCIDACESGQLVNVDNIKWPCGAVSTGWFVARNTCKEVPGILAGSTIPITTLQSSVDGIDQGQSAPNEGMLIVLQHRNGSAEQEYERV